MNHYWVYDETFSTCIEMVYVVFTIYAMHIE